jgi:cobalamin biosynthesis protein CobT
MDDADNDGDADPDGNAEVDDNDDDNDEDEEEQDQDDNQDPFSDSPSQSHSHSRMQSRPATSDHSPLPAGGSTSSQGSADLNGPCTDRQHHNHIRQYFLPLLPSSHFGYSGYYTFRPTVRPEALSALSTTSSPLSPHPTVLL